MKINNGNIQEFKINDVKFSTNDLILIVDNKIKCLKEKIENLKSELSLSGGLISVANKELLNLKSNNKQDINVLTEDKCFFEGEVKRLKNDISEINRKLKKLISLKKQLIDFESLLEDYKDNLNKINEIINDYNKNINSKSSNYSSKFVKHILFYKNNITSIIKKKTLLSQVIDTDTINVGILYNHLNDLDKMEKYYKKNNKNIELVIASSNGLSEFYISPDIDDFIFDFRDNSKYQPENKTSKRSSEQSQNLSTKDYIFDTKYDCKSKKKKVKILKKASNWQKVKNFLKKNIKRVLTGLLIGSTLLSTSQIVAGDLDHVDTISNISASEYSVASNDEINENIVSEPQSIIEEYNNIENSNDLTIGIEVDVSNDIYVNANDATNKQNSLESNYPSTDERTISAIAYSKNGSTDYVTVTKDNKNKIEELKQLKYNVVAYCVSNDSKNIEYEGWHNINDIKVKKI